MSFDSLEFITLIISILIEAPLVGIWGNIRRLEWKLLTIVATASTLVTHSILWQVFNDLLPSMSYNSIPSQDKYKNLATILEIPVVVVEGLMYKSTESHN
jgi:hypothetical protein